MDTVRIRPHHLLCTQRFKGKGYSKGFIENFKEIKRRLEQNPVLEIVAGGDDICKACPYFKDEKCMKSQNSDMEVKKLDGRVLSTLKLSAGMKLRYEDVAGLVEKITNSELPEICGGCEWIEYCTEA